MIPCISNYCSGYNARMNIQKSLVEFGPYIFIKHGVPHESRGKLEKLRLLWQNSNATTVQLLSTAMLLWLLLLPLSWLYYRSPLKEIILMLNNFIAKSYIKNTYEVNLPLRTTYGLCNSFCLSCNFLRVWSGVSVELIRFINC